MIKILKNEKDQKIELLMYFDSKPQGFCANGIDDLPRRWAEVIETKCEYKLDI